MFAPKGNDFSSIIIDADNSLALGLINQTNRVMINEKGCEAASFGSYWGFDGAPENDEVVEFVLDRPFIFCITGDNGLPLFVGIVNCPMGE